MTLLLQRWHTARPRHHCYARPNYLSILLHHHLLSGVVIQRASEFARELTCLLLWYVIGTVESKVNSSPLLMNSESIYTCPRWGSFQGIREPRSHDVRSHDRESGNVKENRH